MAYTFSGGKTALDEIASKIQTVRGQLQQCKSTALSAFTTLSGMESQYGAIVTEILTEAANNPTDQAVQLQAAEANKLVEEYVALVTPATAMKDATAAVSI